MLGPEKVKHVYVKSVGFPSREDLEAIRNEWIEALEEVPPGNGPDRELWVSSVGPPPNNVGAKQRKYTVGSAAYAA